MLKLALTRRDGREGITVLAPCGPHYSISAMRQRRHYSISAMRQRRLGRRHSSGNIVVQAKGVTQCRADTDEHTRTNSPRRKSAIRNSLQTVDVVGSTTCGAKWSHIHCALNTQSECVCCWDYHLQRGRPPHHTVAARGHILYVYVYVRWGSFGTIPMACGPCFLRIKHHAVYMGMGVLDLLKLPRSIHGTCGLDLLTCPAATNR